MLLWRWHFRGKIDILKDMNKIELPKLQQQILSLYSSISDIKRNYVYLKLLAGDVDTPYN